MDFSSSKQPSFKNPQKCYLLLSDGSLFTGNLIGKAGYSVGELIFNTAMSGYQEIITDPSYARQLICFTSPHIGNVGINSFDYESDQIFASSVIIRNYPQYHHNWRAEKSLADWLYENNITAISEIDTRAITHLIRQKGAMNAVIFSEQYANKAKKALANFAGLKNMDLAKEVSSKKTYRFNQSLYDLNTNNWLKLPVKKFKVAVLDFGIKKQILRILVSLGCDLTVFPAQTDFSSLKKIKPDGVFLSNGPGDPEPCDYAIKTIKEVLNQSIPIFGICLGHQLLGLALGAKTRKMHTGHHGANHPVQCLKTKRVLISSQNHGFCLSDQDLPQDIVVTHISLFDNSIQGIEHKKLAAYGFQGHPEASPGPHDLRELFTRFIEQMQIHKQKNA